jgi:hypothetical protein
MAVTDFPDTFLVVDGLVVAAVIIVDLWCSQDTRLAVAERARARLALLKETPTADLIARSSARLHLASTALFGRSALRWRFVALALIASAGLGGVALFAGALVSAPDPGAAIAHAIRFFALPAVACGSLSLALDHWFLGALARKSSLPIQLGLLLLRAAAVLASWLAMMHAGTWLEWQQKRTPLAYGSGWFYAEVYWYYIRDPAGQLVSFTAGVVVALLPALLLLWIALLSGVKLLRPLIEPALAHLLDGFARAGRGVFALWAAAIGVLAGLAHEAVKAL